MQELKRYEFSKLNIYEINVNITAYQQVIDYYEGYIERKTEFKYVREIIEYLTDMLSEYLIARELHIEEIK